jgi:hypothetical protein
MCRSIAMPVGVSSVPAAMEVRLCPCGRQNKLPPHTPQNPRSALAEERYQTSVAAAVKDSRSFGALVMAE